MIKGSISNNNLKSRFVFGFSECGLCRAYLLYVDDVSIWDPKCRKTKQRLNLCS